MTCETLLSVHLRTRALVLTALLMSLSAACESGSPVSSSGPESTAPPSSSTSPPPSSSISRYRLSGRVTSDAGAPIADAIVEVDHGRASSSASTSNCPRIASFCWISTRTNSNGEYALEFEGGSLRGENIGYVYSFADGYETAIQWVPPGSHTPVQDLRLRPIRPIQPGEATSVSVEPSSSLCSDLEDWWMLDYRCEVVHVEATQEGILVVEARDAEGGSVVPQAFFFATSGDYVGSWSRPGPATVSATVRPGLFRIFVGVPEGAARRFDIVASVR